MTRSVPVVDARGAAARDAAAIAAGVPSRTLMQRAGAAAAAELSLRCGERLGQGVAVFAGPGNNGGDAWVVARALAAVGVPVRVAQVGEPKTADAIAERALSTATVELAAPEGGEGIIVDGLLGTGASGPPRGEVAGAIALVEACRGRGAAVVALDVPSGVDATTGRAEGAVRADLTLTFGTMKRGLLVARGQCGRIVVLDIGLDLGVRGGGEEPLLVDSAWVGARVPQIPADAHKGTRRRLAIIGAGVGMAGAAILAARAAVRSGIGLARIFCAEASLPAVQSAAYEATAQSWPTTDSETAEHITGWTDGVLVGPGLGRSALTRALVERVLASWRGPVLLDADALNVFEGDTAALRSLLQGRPSLITPHPAELARLAGCAVADVLDARFEIGAELAREVGAAVLLKGVPTVVSAADGRRLVSAAGTPVLAAAGSGDVLAGIAATLLAQTGDALESGACAAWVHGRAGEIASVGRAARGVTLEDVLTALGRAWTMNSAARRAPVLAELPPVDAS